MCIVTWHASFQTELGSDKRCTMTARPEANAFSAIRAKLKPMGCRKSPVLLLKNAVCSYVLSSYKQGYAEDRPSWLS